jgi:hypothetical protein
MATLVSYSVLNAWCPDGVRRRFYVTGQNDEGDYRGHVRVHNSPVTGHARRRGRGFRFYPLLTGKNLHLVRSPVHPIGARVRIVEDGKVGTVMDVVWHYITPTYTVRLDDRRRLPVTVSGVNSVEPA